MKMHFKKNGGFTLVELIVVIAILAILAAVAIPAYSGYIEKANRAGDEQLLAAINRAYASACLENGTDMALLGGASMPLNADKTVNVEKVEPYGDKFSIYYAGNEASAFKTFRAIVYSPTLGAFCNVDDAPDVSVTVNGKTYTASGSDIAKVLGSTWAEELTSEELLNMVVDTSDMAQAIYSELVAGMTSNAAYKNMAATALGVENYDEFYEGLVSKEMEKYLMDKYGKTLAEAQSDPFLMIEARAEVETEDFKKNINSNVAVLVAAQNAQSVGTGIVDILTANDGVGAKDAIKGTLQTDPTAGLPQAALAYGLYNAYIHSRTDLTDTEKADKITVNKALNAFDDPDFQDYLDSDQGEADLEGLLASLNVISTQDKGTVSSTVTEGLNNPDLITALQQFLGK